MKLFSRWKKPAKEQFSLWYAHRFIFPEMKKIELRLTQKAQYEERMTPSEFYHSLHNYHNDTENMRNFFKNDLDVLLTLYENLSPIAQKAKLKQIHLFEDENTFYRSEEQNAYERRNIISNYIKFNYVKKLIEKSPLETQTSINWLEKNLFKTQSCEQEMIFLSKNHLEQKLNQKQSLPRKKI